MCQWAMKVGGCQAAEMQQTAEDFCQTVVTARALSDRSALALSSLVVTRRSVLLKPALLTLF